jgi:hypothetical protein
MATTSPAAPAIMESEVFPTMTGSMYLVAALNPHGDATETASWATTPHDD